jgi:hypothetical protein
MREKIFKRQKYLQKLNQFKDKPIIKVITGQRRVGKSYILKSFIQELKKKGILAKNIIYINKEDLKFDQITDYQSLNNYINQKLKTIKNKRRIYLFIDEVQEIKDFEKTIRSVALKSRFDIYISGSNSTIISSELSSMLGGRYIEIYVSSLDFKEFCKFMKLKDKKTAFNKYLHFGGMPFLHNLELKDDLVFTYTKNVYNSILLRDIIKKFEIRNINFLEKLISFLSNNIGCIFSANSISKYLKSQKIKITPAVIIDYLEALKASFFIQEAKRFDLEGKRVFKSNSKYYINDIGIRNALVGYGETKMNQLIENIVYLNLKSHGYEVYVGVLEDKEIDFIAKKEGKIKYLQVTLNLSKEETFQREFGNLIEIKDNYEKIVISTDPITKDYKGVKHLNIVDFLNNLK